MYLYFVKDNLPWQWEYVAQGETWIDLIKKKWINKNEKNNTFGWGANL